MNTKLALHTEEEDKCNHENRGKIGLTREVHMQMKDRKELSTTKNLQQNGRNYYIPFNINIKH
jgi:hypothetical protein